MAASAPRTCAAAVSAAAWAVSMSDWAINPACRNSRARFNARSASAARVSAAASSAWLALICVAAALASDSSARSEAAAPSAELAACTGSICASTCPAFTRSPSFTFSATRRPMLAEPMSAKRVATISPDAVTND